MALRPLWRDSLQRLALLVDGRLRPLDLPTQLDTGLVALLAKGEVFRIFIDFLEAESVKRRPGSRARQAQKSARRVPAGLIGCPKSEATEGVGFLVGRANDLSMHFPNVTDIIAPRIGMMVGGYQLWWIESSDGSICRVHAHTRYQTSRSRRKLAAP